ncbi:MAG: large-conductance mechanosensitive channel protein MscL [Proteobacteria bacterium]|nr:large-conductance mechanosensitive channel protein MscL [Pseudomonadota bacterium]
MSFIQEFKTFAMRGNVIDLAVGVVIGGAFGKIVSSLVENIIMPPLGFLTAGVNFKSLAVTLLPATDAHPALTLGYGAFFQSCLDFLIIAFCIFLMVRTLNRFAPKPPPPPPKAPSEVELLMQIRDLLKTQTKPAKKK